MNMAAYRDDEERPDSDLQTLRKFSGSRRSLEVVVSVQFIRFSM